jgi:Flp pilus assembly protein TadG
MDTAAKRPTNPGRRRRQRGNVLVEFAMTSTVLLIIACGVTGFSRIFNIASMAAGAAAAGVQYGGLSPAHYGNLTGMQNAALADTGNYPGATATASQFCACSLGGTQVSCPATCSSGATPETYIQVSVTIPYQSVISYPMLPNPVNVTQVACARVQ